MTQYREILRLYQHGISQRSIALSCKCSRNTVAAANVKKKVGQCLKKTRPPALEKNQATWP